MKYLNQILCCLAVCSISFAAFSTTAVAQDMAVQEMEDGKWNGRLILPSGEITEIFLHIRHKDGKPIGSMEMPGDDRYTMVQMEHEDMILRLSWNPGLDIKCELYRQEEGSYSGSCADEVSSKGPIIFAPPSLAGKPLLTRLFDDWEYYWQGGL